MTIAHLILAHKGPHQLERLIRAIEHPSATVYVHLDRKTDPKPFRHLEAFPRVKFIRNNISVRWGTYDLVQATINGMEEIFSQENPSYFNLLSGQDFPLRPASHIHAFLKAHQGTEFINCSAYSDEDEWWVEALPRVYKYNFQNLRFPGKYRVQHLVNRLLPERRYPLGEVVGRSQWFTVTGECARFQLRFIREHPEVAAFFRWVWGADEFIFATVTHNSPFGSRTQDNLMYTDWSGKGLNPKMLTPDDLGAVFSSGKLYARKFDEELHPGILHQLETHLQEAGITQKS